jgi:transcriptional regulator with XRE-family HTH domain
MPMPQILNTGHAVAANVARIRRSSGITLNALSAKLSEITTERRYPTSTLSEIEHARRRVDVDDLMALAAALNVSPANLLMPMSDGSHEVIATSATSDPIPAWRVWAWLLVEGPLELTGRTAQRAHWERLRFLSATAQPWAPPRGREHDALQEIFEASEARGSQLNRPDAKDIDDGNH